jgi:hypothetical protein
MTASHEELGAGPASAAGTLPGHAGTTWHAAGLITWAGSRPPV